MVIERRLLFGGSRKTSERGTEKRRIEGLDSRHETVMLRQALLQKKISRKGKLERFSKRRALESLREKDPGGKRSSIFSLGKGPMHSGDRCQHRRRQTASKSHPDERRRKGKEEGKRLHYAKKGSHMRRQKRTCFFERGLF